MEKTQSGETQRLSEPAELTRFLKNQALMQD
jgi:hypothetical protein